MTHPLRNRSRLLGGCAGAALALALAMAPTRAAAQGIQATPTVVSGGATITNGPSTTTVNLTTPTAVIDWVPDLDVSGNALDFIPSGSTGSFQTSLTPNFAVLNRILPSPNNNVAVINGTVVSRFVPVSGPSFAAGLVAFYSPTGLLIGNNAAFDVGRLLLTTLDTTPASFDGFRLGGTLVLTGASGSTARIQINPGAQITASPDNSYFAVVAAEIDMRGTALVNGSHAYVVGERVNLRYTNGLFDITVPLGTASSGTVMTVNGTVGGPSSTGAAGDNHMIYGVARAQTDPITMLFSGNLGFEPAVSAGVINGEIILSANYDVAQRQVAGGTISDGINAVFRQKADPNAVRADIFVEDFAASSSLLAIGTNEVLARAAQVDSSVTGNLMLVGKQSAGLSAALGRNFTISGDVLVDSRDYGVVSSLLQSIDEINATGGTARILADTAGRVEIAGNVLVTADGLGGADDLNLIAGSAQGGSALVGAVDSGLVVIAGSADVQARGIGIRNLAVIAGAEARGGTARLYAEKSGTVLIGQNLAVRADAVGANGRLANPSGVSNAFGGTAAISLLGDDSAIDVSDFTELDASASGGSSNTTDNGSLGDAGEAVISVEGAGGINFGLSVNLSAIGQGGRNAGGSGGTGLGGRASALVQGGGNINFGAFFTASGEGVGGNGRTGGDGFGGMAGINVITGSVNVSDGAFATSVGAGGAAEFGRGGDGGLGRGGNAFFQANGTASETATIIINGDAQAIASGFGGLAGQSDGITIAAGRGGDGIGGQLAVPNQADPAFGSGAFILAGGDNGTIIVGGEALAQAQGQGGDGSGDGIYLGGRGGNGFGGLAQVGLALLGGSGTIGSGSAIFGNVLAQADGFGGIGDGTSLGASSGDGGNGTGGFAVLTARAGFVGADGIELAATGNGGFGLDAGSGQGGEAAILGGFGGVLTASSADILATGTGGFSVLQSGGVGRGGTAEMEIDGTTIIIGNNLLLDATGTGGASDLAAGGDGFGGEAYIGSVSLGDPGALTVGGHTQVFANGVGGAAFGSQAAGDGQGGDASIITRAGSTKDFGSLQMTAIGVGGAASLHEGGSGTGGTVLLRAEGAGASLTIARNVPDLFTETLGGSAMLSADGVGELTQGGSGIGGTGVGGTLTISAAGGAIMGLPTDIINDPAATDTVLLFTARGIGGDSAADGGLGGVGIGGSARITLDGAGTAVEIGTSVLSAFGQGGSSANPNLTITGGAGFGGERRVSLTGGATLTAELAAGIASGFGGNGSGLGNGGTGHGGTNIISLANSTLNIVGVMAVLDQTRGGAGVSGGDALGDFSGSQVRFIANDSTISVTPNTFGSAGIRLGGNTLGGEGIAQGGEAITATGELTLSDTTLVGGTIEFVSSARGGNALAGDGIGGNASNAPLEIAITDSRLELIGENRFIAEALGGAGGDIPGGSGGTAVSGLVNLSLLGTATTIAAISPSAPGRLQVESQARGGLGSQVGNATSGPAYLGIASSSLSVDEVSVRADAIADGGPSRFGGTATANAARLALAGDSLVTTAQVELSGNAVTGPGGASFAGSARLDVLSGSTAQFNGVAMRLEANASGADPLDAANTAGQFFVDLGGGSVSLASFAASALGDRFADSAPASLLRAEGGSLLVSGTLDASALGDIDVFTGNDAIIGTPVATGTTAISLASNGSVTIADDDGGGFGLGGRSISVLAGGAILLGARIGANDGPVSLFANNGTALPTSPAVAAEITMSGDAAIAAGSGVVTVHMGDGGGVPGRLSGPITLSEVSAGSIDVRNFGADPGSDINVLATGVLTASGTGRAIDLASLNGEVINLAGDAGLVLSGGGHFGVFAASPAGSQIGSFANYARRYNVADAAAYDAIDLGGNFAAFRIAPVLTVTANDVSRFYGNANPAFTASYAGFQPGDSVADLLGAPDLTTLADGASPVGAYTINAAQGTLVSPQGYQFTFVNGTLTVTPRPITVSADNLSRIYGNANPALTFTVGGLGLVNGDTLTGALATAADATSPVGPYAITQGTLAASSNYALTFVNGTLTVTPRPITVSADNLSRIYGNANPALTFTVGGLGLVNGDTLTGALATAADATSPVGPYAITQG
ncbi:MAG: MBG domain-containing protein, partial [Erythrobacter cryptus]